MSEPVPVTATLRSHARALGTVLAFSWIGCADDDRQARDAAPSEASPDTAEHCAEPAAMLTLGAGFPALDWRQCDESTLPSIAFVCGRDAALIDIRDSADAGPTTDRYMSADFADLRERGLFVAQVLTGALPEPGAANAWCGTFGLEHRQTFPLVFDIDESSAANGPLPVVAVIGARGIVTALWQGRDPSISELRAAIAPLVTPDP